MRQNRNYDVPEPMLKSFLHLRLRDELVVSRGDEEPRRSSGPSKGKERDKDIARNQDGVLGKKRKKGEEPHVSKKMRKVNRKDAEVEKELKEAEAVYDREDVKKKQTETLKFVFLSYFRILKNAPTSPLLSSTLEGLARFAHLINVDFFADLLEVLKRISVDQFAAYVGGDGGEDSEETADSARAAFHCVIAAFQLLTGQGEALKLDLTDFYSSMYTQLMRLPLNPSAATARAGTAEDARRRAAAALSGKAHMQGRSKSEIELALVGFDLMFYRKKQVPVERVAAFVKRFAIVSLHLPANAALACLAMIRSLIIRFPRLESLIDADGRLGTGVYQPLLDDPGLCNPFATSLWEASLFMKHYHPAVRNLSRHVASTMASHTSSGPVSNVYKPLPAKFNFPPHQFLRNFDPSPPNPTHGSYALKPGIEVPGPITTALKRKREKGLRMVDGPSALFKSDFLSRVEAEEGQDQGDAGDAVGFQQLFADMTGTKSFEQQEKEVRRLKVLLHFARKAAALGIAGESSDEEEELPKSKLKGRPVSGRIAAVAPRVGNVAATLLGKGQATFPALLLLDPSDAEAFRSPLPLCLEPFSSPPCPRSSPPSMLSTDPSPPPDSKFYFPRLPQVPDSWKGTKSLTILADATRLTSLARLDASRSNYTIVLAPGLHTAVFFAL
ncbi:CBF/Mak21 family-domain-containing protein [Blyttiomyces helicus]|uniref:CBF/Mak21 family-domain-containing protein n=1 Tax=Blyttiomyces helicus TaxID=388810 RepID=A0A4P9W7S3_9FUNG|nr:CBF/Mak21 family-domain-containing protein [Blyttiomyces helicus]|eukprot:RKO87098.1 CBF/Mak21 family-domain-containing protein [Blyttiomyces helicus]